MKHILLFLLIFHTQIQSEPITVTTTVGTVFLSTSAGAAISSTIIKTFGVITTFIIGCFVDKKIRKYHKQIQSSKPTQKQELSKHQAFQANEPIKIDVKTVEIKQNNNLQKEQPCCSDCEQSTTIECCAKKKSKNKTSQPTEGNIYKQSSTDNLPPEDDPCPPLKERREMVKSWAKKEGFNYIPKAPFYSHGEDVYKRRNRYVTTDRDCHGGGIMKMFEGTKSSIKRVATYNKYFKIFKV